ncbi:amidohydrolase family protein [Phenylobacterium sp.]|uniref:amidohydrolase family protein n=1 Tax=Phenylobacterium sp. TaxID=1871053 RepID=UPI003563E7E8
MAAEGPAARSDSEVIEHVTVLPMTAAGPVLRDRTVVVRDGRIEKIAPSAGFHGAGGAPRIDGRGKYLMPALADMHVHMENDDILAKMMGGHVPPGLLNTADLTLPYVANGVLQVFNLSASPAGKAQRDDIESGKVLGPHIALAVMVDGDPPIQGPLATVAATPVEGRRIVDQILDGGYDALKTYSNLTFDTFSAMVDEARARHLKVLGHIPLRGKDRTAELFQPGYGMVAHAEEFAYQTPQVSVDAIPRFTDLAKARGVWLITTVSLNQRIVDQTESVDALKGRPEMRYVNPLTYQTWTTRNSYAASKDKLGRRQAVVNFNAKLVPAFQAAGVPMVVGTDSLVSGMVPGFALHDELEALAKLGLPSKAILADATRVPAQYLGVASDRGTLEAGKRADLLLLDADPLKDVANTRRIAAVIVGGKVYPRAELDGMMEALALRYAAMPKQMATLGVKLGGHFAPEDDDN